MGRITLFTADHCLYSLQLKHEFNKRSVPFQEINLTEFPEKQQHLFQLTRRMTTPQAFFNTRYVGGSEATLRLLKEWDKDKNFKSAAKKYEAQIGRFPDPSNPHLAIPTKSEEDVPPQRSNVSPIKPLTVELQLPSGPQTYGVTELQDELARVLPLASLAYHMKLYKNSVTGADATTALKDHFCCNTREAAEEIGKQLNDVGILHHCCYDHGFFDTSKLFYRLQCHQTPNVLNSYYILQEDIVQDDVELANARVARMEILLQQLELECFSMDQGGIQYKRGANRAAFTELQEGLCHFQTIGFDSMKSKELLAFGLNVYNIMLRFAFFKYGVPKKESNQQHFLTEMKFNLGGNSYSFHEWLGAISDGKVGRAPSSPTRGSFTIPATGVPSDSKDCKRSILKEGSVVGSAPTPTRRTKSKSRSAPVSLHEYSADYRVYFAANFFRSRGTAVPYFTPENLEKELTIMALAFMADDANVSVDTKHSELHLSNIFAWYRKCFCRGSNLGGSDSSNHTASDKDLTHLVFQYLESPKKLQLQQLMYSGNSKKIKVCFHADDWTANAVKKEFAGFNPAVIEPNCQRFSQAA